VKPPASEARIRQPASGFPDSPARLPAPARGWDPGEGYNSVVRSRSAIVAAALVALLVAADAFGCPNCKDAVDTSDPEGLNLARGYFYSILLMLAMPFTLAGSFGCYVWREMRRQRREQGDGEAGPPVSAEP